jgi:hypothetical protein
MILNTVNSLKYASGLIFFNPSLEGAYFRGFTVYNCFILFFRVCIWLGANVMVEYELEEAQSLLTTHLANIEQTFYFYFFKFKY